MLMWGRCLPVPPCVTGYVWSYYHRECVIDQEVEALPHSICTTDKEWDAARRQCIAKANDCPVGEF